MSCVKNAAPSAWRTVKIQWVVAYRYHDYWWEKNEIKYTHIYANQGRIKVLIMWKSTGKWQASRSLKTHRGNVTYSNAPILWCALYTTYFYNIHKTGKWDHAIRCLNQVITASWPWSFLHRDCWHELFGVCAAHEPHIFWLWHQTRLRTLSFLQRESWKEGSKISSRQEAGLEDRAGGTRQPFCGREGRADNETNPCLQGVSNFWPSPKMAKQNLGV